MYLTSHIIETIDSNGHRSGELVWEAKRSTDRVFFEGGLKLSIPLRLFPLAIWRHL